MTVIILSYGRSKEVYQYYYRHETVNNSAVFFRHAEEALKAAINNKLNSNGKFNADFNIIEDAHLLLKNIGYKEIKIYSNSIEYYSGEMDFDERLYYNLYQPEKFEKNSLFQINVSSAIYLDVYKRWFYQSADDEQLFNSIVKKTVDEIEGTEENEIGSRINEHLNQNGFIPINFHELFVPCYHRLSLKLLNSLGFSEKEYNLLTENPSIKNNDVKSNFNEEDDLPF